MCVRVGLSAQMAACILRILYHASHSNYVCLYGSVQMVAFILCILVRALRTLGNILAQDSNYSRGVQEYRTPSPQSSISSFIVVYLGRGYSSVQL